MPQGIHIDRITFFLLFFTTVASVFSCKKNSDGGNESILYGTWIKGNSAGDTLRFFQRDSKNILAYNVSFNAALPAPTDREYFFRDGTLSIRYLNYPDATSQIPSFRWKAVGKEFEVRGIELFNFMSSTNTFFTYRKI